MGACLSLIEPEAVLASQSPVPPMQPNAMEPVPAARPPLQEPVHEVVQPEEKKPKMRLSQVDPKSVPDLPYQNLIVDAFIYQIPDGDTCKFLLNLHPGGDSNVNNLLKLSLRLDGIDTPEIHAGEGRLPEEKVAAAKSRDRLRQLASGHVKIRMTDWDKYGGRCLGDVILPNGKTAVEVLIEEGYGRPYHGEKKQKWTMEQLRAHPFNITSRELEEYERSVSVE